MKLKTYFLVLLASFLFTYGLNFITRIIEFNGNYWSVPLLFLGLTIFFLVLFKIIEKKSWREYGIKKITTHDFKLSFVFLFLLFPIAFIGRLFDPGFDLWYAKQSGLLTFSGLFFMFLLMPFYVFKEEIFERSLIQSKLSQHYSKVLLAILISLNFSLVHFYVTKEMSHIVSTVISVFFGSLVLIFLYEATKNVFATMICHLVYNCLIVFQIYLHARNLFLAENIFWILYGILFFLTVYTAVKEITNVKSVKMQLRWDDYVFFLVFVSLPLLLYFFL